MQSTTSARPETSRAHTFTHPSPIRGPHGDPNTFQRKSEFVKCALALQLPGIEEEEAANQFFEVVRCCGCTHIIGSAPYKGCLPDCQKTKCVMSTATRFVDGRKTTRTRQNFLAFALHQVSTRLCMYTSRS